MGKCLEPRYCWFAYNACPCVVITVVIRAETDDSLTSGWEIPAPVHSKLPLRLRADGTEAQRPAQAQEGKGKRGEFERVWHPAARVVHENQSATHQSLLQTKTHS